MKENKSNTLPTSYDQYLQSEWWQEIRRESLERADYHCAICSTTEDLQVHHNIYKRIGNEQLSDLVVLCAGCHVLYHHRMDYAKRTAFPIHQKVVEAFNTTFADRLNRVALAGISDGVLSVNTSDSVIMQILNFSRREYVEQINSLCGDIYIKDIVFRIGKIPQHGAQNE